MRVLVLGGYGLIGETVMRALRRAGHQPIGLGRATVDAARRMPWAEWRTVDIAALDEPAKWADLIEGVDAIVNAAGALQDGARDSVAAVQSRAIRALIDACPAAGVRRFAQISAPNATARATTDFMRTKAEADAHLCGSDLAWFILRPGLVIAPAAYGGTALLRALAAFPLILPVSHPDARIQTVHVDDVAATVVRALEGGLPERATYDLVEPDAHALSEVVARLRAWLGRPPARTVAPPRWAARLLFGAGDLLGRLGWRSPMRTTAMREIEAGVAGDPLPLMRATGAPLRSLDQTLSDIPATVQERWFALSWLMKPVAVAILSLFWLASGVIALVGYPVAVEIALQHGFPPGLAGASVIGGAVLDIALGLGVLWRPWARRACLAMAATAIAYLALATLVAPGLWLDPLGALVKVVPAIGLALMTAAVMDER